MPAKDPKERVRIARLGGLTRSATESGADRMAAANAAWRDLFNRGLPHGKKGGPCKAGCEIIPIPQTLPEGEIMRRGFVAYRIHMTRMAALRAAKDKLEERIEEAEIAEFGDGLVRAKR